MSFLKKRLTNGVEEGGVEEKGLGLIYDIHNCYFDFFFLLSYW